MAHTHTHAHALKRAGVHTQTAAADLWLIPWRPNSDRISFITVETEVFCFSV